MCDDNDAATGAWEAIYIHLKQLSWSASLGPERSEHQSNHQNKATAVGALKVMDESR
jgi:hypothetical protein